MIKGKKIAVTASALMLFVINGWCLCKQPASIISAVVKSISTDTGKADGTNKNDSGSVKTTARNNETVKIKMTVKKVDRLQQQTYIHRKDNASIQAKSDSTAKDTTPLDEMVVMSVTAPANGTTGINSLPNQGAVVSEGAHPKAGWSSFNSYLSSNAISPDGKAGEVKLAVLINKMGMITNIAVIKGLSTATNQKAINLVNNGSSWIGNDNGKTESVPVQIMFGK